VVLDAADDWNAKDAHDDPEDVRARLDTPRATTRRPKRVK
jgi:hypothetical protein